MFTYTFLAIIFVVVSFALLYIAFTGLFSLEHRAQMAMGFFAMLFAVGAGGFFMMGEPLPVSQLSYEQVYILKAATPTEKGVYVFLQRSELSAASRNPKPVGKIFAFYVLGAASDAQYVVLENGRLVPWAGNK